MPLSRARACLAAEPVVTAFMATHLDDRAPSQPANLERVVAAAVAAMLKGQIKGHYDPNDYSLEWQIICRLLVSGVKG
ncbi:hypothetical protein N657DRAFT_648844 [Parathielavia appendiculata]|uniref:Uncharacterized protein n=1 Tax=Parathielavia appendiculata TaxID=2587402 RepID=A0AAN6TVE8_9PEZI|nr:hypothetical protein N657DRAFT_648844 [Parathielavia appendiculata]